MKATLKKTLKIFALLLIVGVVGLFALDYWYSKGPYYHASPSGDLYLEPLPGQKEKINLALTKLHPGLTCLHDFFGRDDEYVYLDYRCEGDEQVGYRKEKVVVVRLIKAAYDLNKNVLSEIKVPANGEANHLSTYRLLPKEAYKRYKLYDQR